MRHPRYNPRKTWKQAAKVMEAIYPKESSKSNDGGFLVPRVFAIQILGKRNVIIRKDGVAHRQRFSSFLNRKGYAFAGK